MGVVILICDVCLLEISSPIYISKHMVPDMVRWHGQMAAGADHPREMNLAASMTD